MSTESLRARLDAVTPGPWEPPIVARDNSKVWAQDNGGDRGDSFVIAHVVSKQDVALIAHAPTDLRLLLDVVELCRDVMTALELGILGIEAGGPTKAGIYKELRAALDAFEAAP